MSLDVPKNFMSENIEHHHYRDVRCKPIQLDEKDCKSANRKYKIPSSDNNHCPKQYTSQVVHKLCIFKKIMQNDGGSGIGGGGTKHQVTCNLNKCRGSVVQVATFQPAVGFMASFEQTELAYKNTELETIITQMYYNTNETFCMIACYFQNGFIRQLLVFPTRAKKKLDPTHRHDPPLQNHDPAHQDFEASATPTNKRNQININIVVLDSVSRQHFYRQLPQSVSKLRNIRRNNINKSTSRKSNSDDSLQESDTLVLDYKLFQSLAPRTFPNMRAMFSGEIDVDSDDEENSYGLQVLYGHFRKLGYQTLLQEDSCWYDSWGTLITDNKHRENVSFDWANLKRKMDTLPIDEYGLTHFSCDVFAQYGRTNQFNFPPKVCYNGHLFPDYFLNLTLHYMETIEEDKSKKPGFFYTHLNTGHETSGQRLSQIDGILSQFLHLSSWLPNTWTIIMSDHGPKTTRYSQEFLAGRFEIGHALMFMIIPPNVQQILGMEKTRSLVDNQRRLISTLDIYKAFKTLYDKSGDGLLGYLPENRYCHDIPMYSFMNCLCSEATELISQPIHVQWMAEYALGYLNDQLTEGLLSNGYRYGYHNCERLIGRRFNKVRRSASDRLGGSYTYVMDVVVDKYRGQEIFEVVLKVTLSKPKSSVTNFKHIEVVKWRRVTIYQHFSKCCDQNINVELCICRKESTGLRNPGRDLSRLLATPVFDTITIPVFIDSKCLLLLKRGRVNSFFSYELSNLCNDRVYETKFQLVNSRRGRVKTTRKLPFTVTLRSWYVYYVTTVLMIETSPQIIRENVTFTLKYL